MEKIKRLIKKEGNFKKFNYQGFECIINRHKWGHLCGYVAITKFTPKFLKNYDNCYKLYCHGGLNYFDYGTYYWNFENMNKKQIKRLIKKWYIGFDCGHYGDKMPFFYENSLMMLKKSGDKVKYRDYKNMIEYGELTCMLDGEYRDMNFVKNELESLVKQIIA